MATEPFVELATELLVNDAIVAEPFIAAERLIEAPPVAAQQGSAEDSSCGPRS